jgi:hypothetical protein
MSSSTDLSFSRVSKGREEVGRRDLLGRYQDASVEGWVWRRRMGWVRWRLVEKWLLLVFWPHSGQNHLCV